MQFFNFFPPSGKVPCTRVSREKDHSVFEHVLPRTKDLKKNGGGGSWWRYKEERADLSSVHSL